MDAVRFEIRAYTASFRVPGMMGYQTTSPVPPPATIYGLLAAGAGREVAPSETWIAYRFDYEAQADDLEKIIIYNEGGPVWDKAQYVPKTNVITRQFLFGVCLTLYVAPGEAANALLRPRFPLLLGRSQDVAYVASHRSAVLEPVGEGDVSGVILPFPQRDSRLRSRVMSFATFFPVDGPRNALAVRPFHVIDAARGSQRVSAPGLLFQDAAEKGNNVIPLFDEKVLSTNAS